MDLRSQQIKDSYGNLVTIGTTLGAPTTGPIQNGQGSNVTAITLEGSLTAQQVNSDNLRLDGNTISSTDTNGNVLIQPNGTGDVVINESGADVDFRVEGDTNQNLLFVDASADRIGIGTASPNATLAFGGNSDVAFNTSLGGTGTYAEIKAYNFLAPSNPATNIRFIRDVASVGNDGAICFDTVNAERMRIDSSGNVGIGVTPSAWGGSISSAIEGRIGSGIAFGFGTTTPAVYHTSNAYYDGSNFVYKVSGKPAVLYSLNNDIGNFVWYTAPSGTAGGTISFSEKVRIDSDGLKFNGDTAAANALDDYEEGTWSPVYAPQTGSFTTMTMDVISAKYTKIGRQVTVIAFFQTDNVDVTGGSGDLRIGGLPFTVGIHSAVSVGYVRNWGTAPDGGYANNGNTNINLQKSSVGANSTVSDLTTGATADRNAIMITVTYFV